MDKKVITLIMKFLILGLLVTSISSIITYKYTKNYIEKVQIEKEKIATVQKKVSLKNKSPEIALDTTTFDIPNISKIDTSTWKTYTSKIEKSHFKYPPEWKITEKYPNDQEALDDITLESPNGKINIYWQSIVSGIPWCEYDIPLGTRKDDNSVACPYILILNATRIEALEGFRVISAIVTFDGTHFEPVLALQNEQSWIASGRGFPLFTIHGRVSSGVNGGGPHSPMLSTNGMSGMNQDRATMTQDEARKFFLTEEAMMAKLILLSYTY